MSGAKVANDAFMKMCGGTFPATEASAEPEWSDPDTSGEALCDACDSRCPCRHVMIRSKDFIVEMDGMGFWVNREPVFKWWCRPCWAERTGQR